MHHVWSSIYEHVLFASGIGFAFIAVRSLRDYGLTRNRLCRDLAWLCASSAGYALGIDLALLIPSQPLRYFLFHFLTIVGTLVYFYFNRALKLHLRDESAGLRWVQRFNLLWVAVTAASYLVYLTTGAQPMMRIAPNPRVNTFAEAMGFASFSPTALTSIGASILLVATLYSIVYFFRSLRRSAKREPVIAASLVFSLIALANECLSGTGVLRTSVSILFLSNALAIAKLTGILHREATLRLARLEDELRASTGLANAGMAVGSISHDIREPLAVINLTAERVLHDLQESGNTDQATLKRLAHVRTFSQQISKVADTYLAWVGKASAEPPAQMGLRASLQSAFDLCARRLRARGVFDVAIDCPDDLTLIGYPTMLEMLFCNLITNAADAVAPLAERWLRIEARALPSGRIVVRVTDSGTGVSTALKERLLDTSPPHATSADGSGLGLRIAQQIAERHGGQIAVDEASDHTCMVVTLATESLPAWGTSPSDAATLRN